MPLFFYWQRLIISRISPRRYGATFSNSTYSPSVNDEEQTQVAGACKCTGTHMHRHAHAQVVSAGTSKPTRVGEDSGLV